jgi:hypothetical protein
MIEEKNKYIQELKNEIEVLGKGVYSLTKCRDYKSVFTEFFKDLLTDGVEINVHSEGRNISFLLYDEEVNRMKEIFSLYKMWGLDLDDKREYQLSYYSSQCNSKFEFERLVILGKVAEFMMGEENSKDLCYLHNTVSNINKDGIDFLKSQIYGKERLIQKLKEEIEILEKDMMLELLESTGIIYTTPKMFDIRPNTWVCDVFSIRLVNYTTPTKKTATFEFKNKSGHTYILEKLKVNNIIHQI